MEELGKIVAIKGRNAVVRIKRHSACSKCSHKCSIASTPSHESAEAEFVVENPINARQGQTVKLEIGEQSLVLSSLIVYLIPLASLVVGYFAGNGLAPLLGFAGGEGSGIIGSLLFLGLSFPVVRLLDKLMGKRKDIHPRIKEIVPG